MIEVLVTVGGQLLHRVVQLGGKFNPGRPGANDGDLHLTGGCTALVTRLAIGGKAQKLIHQQTVETECLIRTIEEDTVIPHARGVEVIGDGANGHHQVVIGQLTFSQDLFALFTDDGGQHNPLFLTLDVGQRAQLKLKTVVAGMGLVAQGINPRIQRASRHLMQQRFPQVSAISIHQSDLCLARHPQFTTQLCG